MKEEKRKTQDPQKRLNNFKEVCLGLTQRQAIEEARQFPQYVDPSFHPQCPLGVDISNFIRLLREGDSSSALKKIHEENPFPGICGRVCLAPCEEALQTKLKREDIQIRSLERYVADHGRHWFLGKRPKKEKGKQVAIIGSGPAGLTAAAYLAKHDYRVSVFESLPKAGGILYYGIPTFRLPREILNKEIEEIRHLGVDFITSVNVGSSLKIDDLFHRGFSAVLLTTGKQEVRLMDFPGVFFDGVCFVEELFFYFNFYGQWAGKQFPMDIGRRVVVLGSDNAAFDCARICKRLGNEVTLVYDQIQAGQNIYPDDFNFLKEEKIQGDGLMKPLEILSNKENHVSGVKCITLDYADPNSSGQWQLMPVPDTEFFIEADTVFVSSEGPFQLHGNRNFHPLKLNEDGSIWLEPGTSKTSLAGVFVAGSASGGCRSIVDAMQSAKKAVGEIMSYLDGTKKE